MTSDRPLNFERKRIWLALLPAIVFVALVWLSFVLDKSGALNMAFRRWGVLPREAGGLLGIVFSPFIHSSLSHLLSNSLPLLILISFHFYFYSKIAVKSFVFLWLISGFITWCIGRDAYHVGASGVVFSLISFLFFSGIFRKYVPLIALSLIVAFVYGSSIWSIFPFAEYIDTQISWEGHLSGVMSGFVIAFIYRNHGPQKPEVAWEDDEMEEWEEGDDWFFVESDKENEPPASV